MTKVGGVVSVLVVIAIIVLAGALVHRFDHHDVDDDYRDDDVDSKSNTSCIDNIQTYEYIFQISTGSPITSKADQHAI